MKQPVESRQPEELSQDCGHESFPPPALYLAAQIGCGSQLDADAYAYALSRLFLRRLLRRRVWCEIAGPRNERSLFSTRKHVHGRGRRRERRRRSMCRSLGLLLAAAHGGHVPLDAGAVRLSGAAGLRQRDVLARVYVCMYICFSGRQSACLLVVSSPR